MCVVITLIKYLKVVAIISPKQQQNSIIIPMPAKKKNNNNEISVSWNKQWKGYFLSKIIGLGGIRKTRKPNYLESLTIIIVGTDDSHTYLLSNCWAENLTWDTHCTYTFIYNFFAFTKVQPYSGPAPYKPSVPTCFCDKPNVSWVSTFVVIDPVRWREFVWAMTTMVQIPSGI